jgi:hypothetical protein
MSVAVERNALAKGRTVGEKYPHEQLCATTDPMTALPKWNETECQNVTKRALSDSSRVTPISKQRLAGEFDVSSSGSARRT